MLLFRRFFADKSDVYFHFGVILGTDFFLTGSANKKPKNGGGESNLNVIFNYLSLILIITCNLATEIEIEQIIEIRVRALLMRKACSAHAQWRPHPSSALAAHIGIRVSILDHWLHLHVTRRCLLWWPCSGRTPQDSYLLLATK